MGVALGDLEPTTNIEATLGNPHNREPGIKGWEDCEIYLSDGLLLECQSTYLEQFDLGADGFVYQITCFVADAREYEKHFNHHTAAYESSLVRVR